MRKDSIRKRALAVGFTVASAAAGAFALAAPVIGSN